MLQINFLEDCCKFKADSYYKEYIENNYRMTFPVVMGIVSQERIEVMTADEIGIAYEMAVLKQKLTSGGGTDG